MTNHMPKLKLIELAGSWKDGNHTEKIFKKNFKIKCM